MSPQHRRLVQSLIALLVGVLTVTACAGPEDSRSESAPDGGEQVRVVRVVDGDTLLIEMDGEEATVRLLGVDTPERGECHASEATEALAEMVDEQRIVLHPDVSDRDRYGRLLRYVWLDDGTFVNEKMVRNGHAMTRRQPPDEEHDARLAEAQQIATDAGAGRWHAEACGPSLATADVQITHIEYDAPGRDEENPNGEWIEITNIGDTPVDLGGWGLRDESSSNRYRIPDEFQLPAGATLRVMSGCGPDRDMDLHWCSTPAPVWNNSGDTGYLTDPSGNIVDSYTY